MLYLLSSRRNNISEHALRCADNTYQLGDVCIKGQVCCTNLMSSTAFRGFGGPQSNFLTECMLDHVGATLSMEPEEVFVI